MSTRIQDLAEQAKNSIPKDKFDVVAWIEAYNQRFAELLVQECITAIESTDRHRSDYFTAKIREHFGVER